MSSVLTFSVVIVRKMLEARITGAKEANNALRPSVCVMTTVCT